MKATSTEEIVIKPPQGLGNLNLKEILKYRHLLWSMVWKDLRIQFDSTYFGFFWAISLPLTMVTVFTLFRRFSSANMHVSIAYPLYVYSGLILWFYFREAVMMTSRSVLKDAGLIKKIYFPRVLSPISTILTSLYPLLLSIIPLIIMMVWYSVFPNWRLLLLPIVLLQCMALIMGVGTISASASIKSKDGEKLLRLMLYLGLFISPVIFAPEMIPVHVRDIYYINPIAGTLLAFRACLFNNFDFPVWQFVYSTISSLIFLMIGITLFRKAEIYFADRL
jgi:lipopolysaccharide transport system permease protein